MTQFSYTVTPSISEDPVTGEQTYNVMDATVESSAYKEEINAANNRGELQEQTIEEGTEVVETITPIDEADATFLTDTIFGGLDNYRAQLQWAGENLTQEDIEEYDNAVETGDIMTCKHYMEQLSAKYAEAQQFETDTNNWKEYFYNNVASEEEYSQIQEWANNNLEPQEIEVMNQLVENEDYAEFEHLIKNIQRNMELMNNV